MNIQKIIQNFDRDLNKNLNFEIIEYTMMWFSADNMFFCNMLSNPIK